MEESGRSVETTDVKNIQNAYTADDVARLQQRFSNIPTEDDELGKYNDMRLAIRRRKDKITSFSQTLNYVLVHSTKPGSETRSMIRRIMKRSNGFKVWRQLTLHYAGGHRAQQLSLLRTIMSPSWKQTIHKTMLLLA
eukprot:4120392-Amphidinium_carterae.1